MKPAATSARADASDSWPTKPAGRAEPAGCSLAAIVSGSAASIIASRSRQSAIAWPNSCQSTELPSFFDEAAATVSTTASAVTTAMITQQHTSAAMQPHQNLRFQVCVWLQYHRKRVDRERFGLLTSM